MSLDFVARIEAMFRALSDDEQAQLVERLSQKIQPGAEPRRQLDPAEWARMAADPEIQREVAACLGL